MITEFPKEVSFKGPKGTYRTPDLNDTEEIRAILSDNDTMRYLKFMTKPGGWTQQQVQERLKNQLQGQKENRTLVLHIIYEGKIVGMSGFTVINTAHRNAEVGIILDKAYWGKNLATEAFYFSLKWAFDELGLHRVKWVTTNVNQGMRGWLEKVCGVEVEQISRESLLVDGEWLNEYTYALFEDDWRNRLKPHLEYKVYKS
ncbi:acyl-CoA N-acyltransferase [Umbelopsis sp. PMI_123]|nr:acyl-CoA N-acyltransferase [Umbelopsis sp. PMI_123]